MEIAEGAALGDSLRVCVGFAEGLIVSMAAGIDVGLFVTTTEWFAGEWVG